MRNTKVLTAGRKAKEIKKEWLKKINKNDSGREQGEIIPQTPTGQIYNNKQVAS